MFYHEKKSVIDTYCATVKCVGISEIFPLFALTLGIFFPSILGVSLKNSCLWFLYGTPGVNHIVGLGGRLRSLCAWLYVCEGLRFCISCHISCLSPAFLSRLPGPVLLMGFGWRVEWRGRGGGGCGGWRLVDKWSMSGLHFRCRLGHVVDPQKDLPGCFLARNVLNFTHSLRVCVYNLTLHTHFWHLVAQKTSILLASNLACVNCVVRLCV